MEVKPRHKLPSQTMDCYIARPREPPEGRRSRKFSYKAKDANSSATSPSRRKKPKKYHFSSLIGCQRTTVAFTKKPVESGLSVIRRLLYFIRYIVLTFVQHVRQGEISKFVTTCSPQCSRPTAIQFGQHLIHLSCEILPKIGSFAH
ncbi:hypothetical protein T05_7255 [Trichinella murrelli]|uniref:Uncharacterized protein n=1 Tax=Trichinella murrelli TaxID=144512 RepID=A0A0V0THC3_9BILA|nr:hypothetical protein T05_7255 [Trichinella murrelli]